MKRRDSSEERCTRLVFENVEACSHEVIGSETPVYVYLKEYAEIVHWKYCPIVRIDMNKPEGNRNHYRRSA